MEFTVKDLYKTFYSRNGSVQALGGVNLSVRSGEVLAVVGPSGCGKSTMLQIIAGLIPPTAGQVSSDREVINKPSPEVAIIFQEYALFPWRTIIGNLQYVLEVQKVPRHEWRERCEHYLNTFQLWDFRNAYPSQLSGGMKQRTALARALVGEPRALLMDEPFSSLDAITRHHSQKMLVKILEKHPKTVIFVTHDVDEALMLGSRIVIFSDRPGRIKKMIEVPKQAEISHACSTELLNIRSYIWRILEQGTAFSSKQKALT